MVAPRPHSCSDQLTSAVSSHALALTFSDVVGKHCLALSPLFSDLCERFEPDDLKEFPFRLFWDRGTNGVGTEVVEVVIDRGNRGSVTATRYYVSDAGTDKRPSGTHPRRTGPSKPALVVASASGYE